MLVEVPSYAKSMARMGLRDRKKGRYGLDKEEADELGVYSGVERAKQLIDNKYISEEDARQIARFYLRFRNCRTPRCNGAINLWGGRRFGMVLANKYYGK